MLHTDMAVSAGAPMPLAAETASRGRRGRTGRTSQQPFHVTWSAIELSGESLVRDRFDVAVSMIIEALKLADSHSKSELLILNIAPNTEVGSAIVTELQEQVEEMIGEAAARIGKSAPEIRLSLRGAEYDLRCYLGRNKPSDFYYEQEA